jgi:endonuclease/exonuclease/phosphatase family metal-dependent hydrolase
MAFVFRKITKRVFIIINIIAGCVFLLACCNSFLNPQQWWFIAMLGLAFPFLLLIVILFLIFWLLFRSRWALLSAICLLLGYSNIRALVGFHFGREYTEKKPETALRILTWNVTWFDEQTREVKNRVSFRKDMFDFIAAQNPDILCFQEYVELNNKGPNYNNLREITKLGYPYHVIAYDYFGWKNSFWAGVAIYSKYPIVDSFRIRYGGSLMLKANESFIGGDIIVRGKKIRICTTHLQSVLFQKNDYRNLEIIRTAADSMYEASKSLVKKLKQGYKARGDQVDLVRKYLDESPYPAIMCGDFNDIPNSYTYFKMKGERKDAFREAGSGIGHTFSKVAPTLRIDYIMADKKFEILQYFRYFLPYSEHYPVIADVALTDTAN